MIAIDLVGTNLNSGTKTYNINFCKHLSKEILKNEIFVFVCKNYINQFDFDLKKNNKIKFIIKSNILSITFFRIIWMQFFLPFELKFLNVKVHYSPMNFSPLLLKFFKIKSVLALHSNLPWVHFNLMPGNFLRKFLTKKFMEISIRLCEVLIVQSHFAKNEISKILKLNKEKIFTIYPGVDEKFLKNNKENYYENLNKKDKSILSVLSCARYHNIINMLKAFRLLKDEINFEISFILVLQILDKSYFNEIKRFINENFKEKEVIIYSNLQTNDLINLYKKTNLYIFTSYCEVFGLTTIEAMSQNCPIIVSNTSALKEINGEAADYFDPNNIDEIKNLIKKNILYENGIELIAKSKNHYQKYNWKKCVSETLSKIYNININ